MSRPACIIFDFDGVLVDTELLHLDAVNHALEGCAAPIGREEWVAECIGMRSAEIMAWRLGVPVSDGSLPVLVEKKRLWYVELLAKHDLRCRRGIGLMVAEARAEGVLMAVASSSSREEVEASLLRLSLISNFSVLTCGDDVSAGKPDPEIYQRTLNRMGLAARQAFALEDAPIGIAAAKSAGVFTAAYPNAYTAALNLGGADRVIWDLDAAAIGIILTDPQQLPRWRDTK